jgi:cytochrome c-type biogenesis protein CcmF
LPFFLLIVLLAGLCILVGWKTPDLKKLNKQLLWPAAGALLVVIALIVAGRTQWYALVPFFILAAVFIATVVQWGRDVDACMRGKKESFLPAFSGLFMANRSRYGGYIIHIAIVVLALGIIGSSAYKSQAQQQTLSPGDTVRLSGYTFKYNGFDYSNTQKSEGVYWQTITANMDLLRDGSPVASFHPSEVDQFVFSGQTITDMSVISNKVAIRSTLVQDYYVILENYDENQQAIITVLINPLVQWIWIGGLLLLVGGLVSFSATPRKITASDDKE